MQNDLIDQAKAMLDKYGKIKITVQIFESKRFFNFLDSGRIRPRL